MNLGNFFHHFSEIAEARNASIRLRGLVLQLAFEGKLNTGNSLDESVVDLVERVKAEKEKKESQTRRTKQEPQPDISSQLVLPKTWTQATLGEVTQIVRGVTFPGSEKSKLASNGKVAS